MLEAFNAITSAKSPSNERMVPSNDRGSGETPVSRSVDNELRLRETSISNEVRARLVSEIESDNLTMSIQVGNSENEALIQLRSKQTGEIVATIPAEHSRNIKNTIRAVMGQILDRKA